ncbi:hypothetical protein JK358_23640 [Nocardia sp. 2]|uniref:Lipoprotein LpqE n=1 Tax=Nocardia acididurans TaxID=2802282 RepID=A0ABS1MBL5_9NOCA|nr:hypothetical protein [Nocardia acididurans]MBL1077400.1 hypothetical protein [Nocardia acididurans]
MTALKATTASKARRHAVTVAALAAGAVLTLSGCGAGQISQTADQVAAVNGNNANVGQVDLRDVRFLLPQTEEYRNAKGGKAVLAFSAVNFSEGTTDKLVRIESELGTVTLNGETSIKPQTTLVSDLSTGAAEQAEEHGTDTHGADSHGATTTSPAAPATPAADQGADPDKKPLLVEVTGLTKDVTPGLTYPVTFIFEKAGTVVVNVPVDAGPDLERKESPNAGAEAPKGGGH